MRLLDLFCGAGGASVGYYDAGFEIVGVDIRSQPNYPFEFHLADALEFPLDGFDAIHASPPCQKFSIMRRGMWKNREHPDLINPIRNRLAKIGIPYIMENVCGSPLRSDLILCGTKFALQTSEGSQLRRHRIFELNWPPPLTPPCCHNQYATIRVYGGGQDSQGRYNQELRRVSVPPGAEHRRPATIGVYGNSGGRSRRDGYDFYGVSKRCEAMKIDWMTGKELNEAVPPAYTEFIGRHLRTEIERRRLRGKEQKP